MYIPPPNQLSEESKQILDGIKNAFDMSDNMYNGVFRIMEETGLLDAMTKTFVLQCNKELLLKSGVDENTIINSNEDDLINIDNPDDPLDEEDPFNPYDFI